MTIPKDKLIIKIKDAGNIVRSYKHNIDKISQESPGHITYEYDSPTGREKVYDRDIMRGIQSMPSTKINHCLPGMAGGMAGCAACKLRDPNMKPNAQKACDFYEKARFHTRCCYETFGEYCWSTKAQDAARKG
jgi:hypothetical protein